MTFQYSLRFESGERRGEVVPLTIVAAPGGTFTIGRKPGNSLQVTDPSISGRHAELEVDDHGVSLRDLNSTNGTMVAGRKVRQTSLEPGDELTLGAVEFTLLEGAATGAAGSAKGGSASADADPDELVLEDPSEIELEPAAAPAAAPAIPRKKAAPKPDPAPRQKPAAPKPSPAAPKAAPSEGLGATQIVTQEEGLEITAEDLARSAKSSKLGPILLVGLAAVGGGAWWWLGQQSGEDNGGRRAAAAAPTAPAGNLLTAGYSFEKTEGWISEDGGAAEFAPARSARRSGTRGIQADLAGGDVAVIASDVVRLSDANRSVEVSGYARADAGVEVRLGLRYADGAEGGTRSTVWSSPFQVPADEFREVTLSGTAPKGLDRVEVLLRAECTDAPAVVDAAAAANAEEDDSYAELKSVSLDDVALVPKDPGIGSQEVGTFTVTPLAAVGASEVLALSVTTLSAPLITSVRVAKAGRDGSFGLTSAPFALAVDGGSARLSPSAGGQLVLRAEAALVDGGIATLGGTGFAVHGGTFERAGVRSLILGDDTQMIAVKFASPVTLAARAAGSGVTFRAELAGADAVTLQMGFMQERTRAQRLARRAKEERSSGLSGTALATWGELLREVPFDTRLVGEATVAQGEMLGEGRAELKGLVEEVERARFFRLADLFREKLVRAEALAERFRGSDVETEAVALCDAIKIELSALDSSSERDELRRLEAIRSVLEREGANGLAARLEAYAKRSGGPGGGSGSSATTTTSTEGGQ